MFEAQEGQTEERGLDEEQVEIRRNLLKEKTLGNVRFIGELYKVDLVNISTILNISRELIDRRLPKFPVKTEALELSEDRLEAVNILLGTVKGSFKERSKIIAVVNAVYSTLQEIVKRRPDISAKTKYRLMVRSKQNLIEERAQQIEQGRH